MKKVKSLLFIPVLVIAIVLSGCGNPETGDSAVVEVQTVVSNYEDFDAAETGLTREEFESSGFKPGDSCDVTFSNGFTLNDVPYYTGYYVDYGSPVIVGYPGYDHIVITRHNLGIWKYAGLDDSCTVTIRMNTPGKYLTVQDTLGQQYSDNREDYESNEEFCNFRTLAGGNLKDNYLYRGASPVDNTHCRAAYTDSLIKNKQIQFIINLADSEEKLKAYMEDDEFNSPYAAGLYNNNGITLLSMDSGYQSDIYKQKLVEGLRDMIAAGESPVYIHCQEGKDRTGFVCVILEALAGANYDEMLNDYMTTYENYYDITAEKTPEKYKAVSELYFDGFVSFLHGTEDKEVLKNADYTRDAAEYLKSGGMTDMELQAVTEFICK